MDARRALKWQPCAGLVRLTVGGVLTLTVTAAEVVAAHWLSVASP